MRDNDCRFLLVKDCNEGGDGTFCLDVLEFIQDSPENFYQGLFPKCSDCPFYLIWEGNVDEVAREEVRSLLKAIRKKENDQ